MLENDSVTNVKYEILLNGVPVAKRNSPQLAEAYILSLPEADQSKASIRPVTSDGKQILLD